MPVDDRQVDTNVTRIVHIIQALLSFSDVGFTSHLSKLFLIIFDEKAYYYQYWISQ